MSRNVVQGIGDNLDKYSDDDDKKMLLDVEENIANLERTLATKTATRVKKKNILKRMISRDVSPGRQTRKKKKNRKFEKQKT